MLDGLGSEPDAWALWWHFNRWPYLALKSRLGRQGALTGSDEFFLGHGDQRHARDGLLVSRTTAVEQAAPVLLSLLREEDHPDVLSAALVALARIVAGEGAAATAGLRAEAQNLLSHASQEVSETAALALGITGEPESVPVLLELLRDTRRGQMLIGSTEVNLRTRAFSAFALGLIANRVEDAELRQQIARHLIAEVEGEALATPDLEVACVIALGLTPAPLELALPHTGLGREPGSFDSLTRHVVSRRAQVAYLLGLLEPGRRPSDRRHLRAQVPAAIARLLDGAPESMRRVAAQRFLGVLRPRVNDTDGVRIGCLLGLGELGATDDHELNVEVLETLESWAQGGRHPMRNFATLALARWGVKGPRESAGPARKALLRLLARGKTQQRPWAGLALGVLGAEERATSSRTSEGVDDALQSVASDCVRPSEIGGFALALGLRGAPSSYEVLVERLDALSDEGARGDLCVALGLLGDRRALDPIRDVLADSRYRPHLMSRAAIGLALLSDKGAVPELVDLLANAKSLSARASISSALGLVGDARAVDPLIAMIANPKTTDIARAFAIVALGSVCDRDPLPWSTPLAFGINYRAPTATLTHQARGVLDIL